MLYICINFYNYFDKSYSFKLLGDVLYINTSMLETYNNFEDR
jgi:hypothetical protein